MEREKIWQRLNELEDKDEWTEEDEMEYNELQSLDWFYEEEDIRASMYGY